MVTYEIRGNSLSKLFMFGHGVSSTYVIPILLLNEILMMLWMVIYGCMIVILPVLVHTVVQAAMR